MADAHEVLVVGGGPAGAAVSALLAARGLRVAVLERETFPRFQVGESLLPRSCAVFRELGLMDALEQRFVRKYGARFVCARTSKQNRYRFVEAYDKQEAYAFEVQRAPFDQLLLERAAALGAEVWQPCAVEQVLFEGERAVGLRVRRPGEGDAQELRAAVVVDASGRGTLMANQSGGRQPLPRLDASAMFAHFSGVPHAQGDEAGDIVIVMGERGWLWFIPFRDGTTSVGAVMPPAWMQRRQADEPLETFFMRTLHVAPWAADALASAERITPIRDVTHFSYGAARIVGDGWLCVGDGLGFIDPLFSSGVHLALEGARLAADVIAAALASGDTSAARFADYERVMRSASEVMLGVVQAAYEGDFRQMLFADDQRKALRQIVTSMLSGDVIHVERPPTWLRFLRERYPVRR